MHVSILMHPKIEKCDTGLKVYFVTQVDVPEYSIYSTSKHLTPISPNDNNYCRIFILELLAQLK